MDVTVAKSILRSELKGVTFFSFFYMISGVILLIIFINSNFTLIHIGPLGVISLITSYGLNRMRRWAIFTNAILTASGFTVSLTSIYFINSTTLLYNLNLNTLIFTLLMVTYASLLLSSLIYVLIKREKFG